MTVHCCLTLPVNFPFQTVCVNNVEFYNHLKFHLNRSVEPDRKFACNYCLAFFSDTHVRDHHHKTVSVTSVCKCHIENFYIGVWALQKYTQY